MSTQTPPKAFFDDSNSALHFDSHWFTGKLGAEFLGSAHATNTSGAQATFSFFGAAIKVFGTFDSRNAANVTLGSFSVDQTSQQTIRQPPGLNQTSFGQVLFEQKLDQSVHTLVITAKLPNANTTFWIDFIEVSPSVNSKPPFSGFQPHQGGSGSSNSRGNSGFSHHGSSNSSSSFNSQASPASEASQPDARENMLPAVAALSAVASLLLLVIIIFVALSIRRRKIRRRQRRVRLSAFVVDREKSGGLENDSTLDRFSSVFPSMASKQSTGPISYYGNISHSRNTSANDASSSSLAFLNPFPRSPPKTFSRDTKKDTQFPRISSPKRSSLTFQDSRPRTFPGRI